MEPELPVVSFVTEKKAKTKKTPPPSKKQQKPETKKRKSRDQSVSDEDEDFSSRRSASSTPTKKQKRQEHIVEEENAELQIETLQDHDSEDSSDFSGEENGDNDQEGETALAPDTKKQQKKGKNSAQASNAFGNAVEKLLAKAAAAPADQPTVLSAAPVVPRKAKEPKKPQASDAAAREEAKKQRELKIQKSILRNKDHISPELTTEDFELKLRKFATKGVVKLFNALKQHGRQFKHNTNHLQTERAENLSKGKFFEILQQNRELTGEEVQRMLGDKKGEAPVPTSALLKPKKEATVSTGGGLSKFGKNAPNSAQNKSAASSQWDVLKDDYLLGARMKDWNKESDEEGEMEGEGEEAEMEAVSDDE